MTTPTVLGLGLLGCVLLSIGSPAAAEQCPRSGLLPAEVPILGCAKRERSVPCLSKCGPGLQMFELTYDGDAAQLAAGFNQSLRQHAWRVTTGKVGREAAKNGMIARSSARKDGALIVTATRIGKDGTTIVVSYTPALKTWCQGQGAGTTVCAGK